MSRIGKSQFVKITVMLNGKPVRAIGIWHTDENKRMRIAYMTEYGSMSALVDKQENVHWIHGWPRRAAVDTLAAAWALAEGPFT